MTGSREERPATGAGTRAMSAADDARLGTNRGISRRDFLNGIAIGVGAALGGGAMPGLDRALRAEAIPNGADAYYPPALTGMRGSHDGSWENAHLLRDGSCWSAAPAAVDTREAYDLVVVGGGISGLAAAYFFRERNGGQRIEHRGTAVSHPAGAALGVRERAAVRSPHRRRPRPGAGHGERPCEPRGTFELPSRNDLGIRVGKDIAFGPRMLRLSLDILNLLDDDTPLSIDNNSLHAATYLAPTQIFLPRRAILGIRYNF